jgi:hypothetical protein
VGCWVAKGTPNSLDPTSLGPTALSQAPAQRFRHPVPDETPGEWSSVWAATSFEPFLPGRLAETVTCLACPPVAFFSARFARGGFFCALFALGLFRALFPWLFSVRSLPVSQRPQHNPETGTSDPPTTTCAAPSPRAPSSPSAKPAAQPAATASRSIRISATLAAVGGQTDVHQDPVCGCPMGTECRWNAHR